MIQDAPDLLFRKVIALPEQGGKIFHLVLLWRGKLDQLPVKLLQTQFFLHVDQNIIVGKGVEIKNHMLTEITAYLLIRGDGNLRLRKTIWLFSYLSDTDNRLSHSFLLL
jgi:hypothetical protein